LQHLAAMDTTELLVLIDGIIDDYKLEQERIKEEKELALEQGVMFLDNSNNPGNQRLGGKWYFYNTQAMSMGRSDFINKWGDRKLEDNWRLSDKRMMLQTYDEEASPEGEEDFSDTTRVQAEVVPTDPETREFYLAGIPFTDKELETSREMVIEAYKKLGFLYLEELNDTLNALNTYLEFQEKYPDNKYRIESWYALYKICNERGKTEKAAYYKTMIISNYPDSDYAKVIMDPDYYIKQSEQKGQASKLYERAYKAYNKEQYYRVITYSDRAIREFPEDTALMPRFMYLRAISLGKVEVPDTMYVALTKLVETYPASAVVPRAKAVMDMLNKDYGIGVPVVSVSDSAVAEEISVYKYEPDAMHLVIVILNSPDIEVDPLKVRISDFKKKYFRLVRLRIKSLMLDNQRALITIGNFDDERAAYDFYYALKNDNYVTSGMGANEFEVYSISVNNYPVLYREKNVKAYKTFFDLYYQKDK
jgi:outer membrane protein assembly factor BamD (BamD/ComL family)